jgi:hypothetical protein
MGKNHYENSNKTTWYGFYSKSIRYDTRCGYCRKILEELDIAKHDPMFHITMHSKNIDCDSLTDKRIAYLNYNTFTFQVLSSDRKTPRLVHPPKASARDNGLLVVEMPETDEYCISISPKALMSAYNKYFSFTMKVGDEPVIVNGGKPIYYKGETIISCFETGKASSFKFVAHTKENSDTEVKNNDLNSNIITISINIYERIRTQSQYAQQSQCVQQASNDMDYNVDYDNVTTDTSDNGKWYYAADSDNTNTLDGVSSSTSGVSSRVSGASSTSGASGVSGVSVSSDVFSGRTEQGSTYIPTINAVKTSDKFSLIDGFTVTIQLIYVDRSKQNIHIVPFEKIAQVQQHILRDQHRLLVSNATKIHPDITINVDNAIAKTTNVSTKQPIEQSKILTTDLSDDLSTDLSDDFVTDFD